MSQSHIPTDNQALLQSMLQRLKIQPGRDSQTHLHTPVPIAAVTTCVQDGERGASNTHSPVNGFQFGTNGVPSKGFGISSLKDGEIQQPGLGCKVDGGLTSFPTLKSNTDGDKGENSVMVRATHPGISPIGTEQLFPAKSLRDTDVTASERTSAGRVMNDEGAARGMAKNQDQDQSFTPKVYMWSVEPTNANYDVVSQERKVVHMENGGFGALAQNEETHIVLNDQITTKSNSRRKQQSSENKTRRWTQKLKERWKDRRGSFSKKAKEEQREEQQSEQGTKISPQNQLLTVETPVNTPNKKEDTSDSSKTPLMYAEGGANQGITRPTTDFEFGLGSFSLLEEITTGQEWATFLKPNQSAALANQRLSVKPKPHDCSQPSLIVKHKGDLKNQLVFRGTKALPLSDFGMAQTSPDELPPFSMDVSDGKQQQYADQSEPMEHGHAPSDVQSVDSGVGQDLRPPSFTQPANILSNLALKGRVHLNRKRQHQSAERRDMRLQTEKICDGKETDGEESVFLSPRCSDVMKTRVESEHDDVVPLYTLNSPPVSPSSALPRKGVLRHSLSQDSESSVVIVTKRRRVEENRRVRFSEEVVAIMPPDLELSSTESEEDSGAEEYSTTEGEQEVKEEVPPARRPALPAWILALKSRNTGRKHRK